MSEGGLGTEEGTRERTESPPPKFNAEEKVASMEGQLDYDHKRPDVPKFTFREKKEDLESLGWNDDNQTEVRRRLERLLDIDPKSGSSENALELLIASGRKPEELLNERDGLLTEENLQSITDQLRAQNYPAQEISRVSKSEFLKGLGVKREDYIQRFVLDQDYEKELKYELDNVTPHNLYDLAWNIAAGKDKEEFGVKGTFPVLELRFDMENGKIKEGTGRYCVNEANFIRWIRAQVMHWQDQSPDDWIDYFAKVQLSKSLRPVTLGEILNEDDKYFRDENGQKYNDLFNQSLMEPWVLSTIREYHISLKGVMHDGKAMTDAITKLFSQNKLTKKAVSKSQLYYLSTLALDFDGGSRGGDNTLGAAWNTMYLAYYNFSDYDELEKTLGKDSSFFTRKGMEQAIQDVLKTKYNQTEVLSQDLGSFMGKDNLENFQKAFGKKGEDGKTLFESDKVVDKAAFISLINYFGESTPNSNKKDMVTAALSNTIKEQYNFQSSQANGDKGATLDTHSLGYAALIADAMTIFTGASAKNDVGAAGFNSMSKMFNLEAYRRKMATQQRGNAFGNPYTVPMFKSIVMDFMRGTRVSEAYVKDKDGKTTKRKKTPLEVMQEMQTAKQLQHQEIKRLEEARDRATGEEKVQLQHDIDAQTMRWELAYKQLAGQLEFHENTMSNYASNHYARASKVNEQIMGAKQIEFESFSKYDPYTRTVSFDRAKFQKEIQEDFLKPLRYLYETSGELNLSMPVRFAVHVGRDASGKDKRVYKTMPMGEALFGYEILNIKDFWKEKTDADGKPIKGKYEIKNGRHVIDYNKVDSKEGKTKVWKQWAMMKIGADLWSHIDKHSKDPNYGIQYFRSVLEAVESIPGEVMGDEFSMKDVTVTTKFYSKEQMKWLKKLTKTTDFRLFMRGIWQDMRHKSDGGISDSFALLLNSIFRGY